MKNIIMIGSSGHAKVVLDIVEKQGLYKVVGLIDAYRSIGEETLGYRVMGAESDIPKFREEYALDGFIVAIGDNAVRARVARSVSELCPGLPAVSAIHPSARIGLQAGVGVGTVVMAGAVINPCCRVQDFCIVNTNAALDHDSVMEDYSSLAPGVTTGGNCRIGSYSAICIGATLAHGVHIGEHCVVGAGAVVLQRLEAYSLAYGTPARKIRERKAGDKYL